MNKMIRLWRITGPDGISLFSSGDWLRTALRKGVITDTEYFKAWNHPDGADDIPQFGALSTHEKSSYLFAFQSRKLMLDWFERNTLKKLVKAGGKIKCFVIEENSILFGEQQCCYKCKKLSFE